MRITIKLFAYLRDYLPQGTKGLEAEIEVKAGATAGEILKGLGVPLGECRLAMFNGITDTDPAAWMQKNLTEGDTLAVLPNIH